MIRFEREFTKFQKIGTFIKKGKWVMAMCS
ncbi:hypothetical protein M495_09600 [Serratia liquefaciens ATCC 27592]|nr:hypothetical protein M495_09600 [Serratia liquefaciens ATCC 27592]